MCGNSTTRWLAFVLLASGLSLAADSRAQGPYRVADINSSRTGSSYIPRFPNLRAAGAVVDGVAYFTATDGIHGSELWRSDGTPAGTRLVRDLCNGSCSSFPGALTALGSHLYFYADDHIHGRELWRTDGTHVGTQLVIDLVSGLAAGAPLPLGYFETTAALGGALLFTAFTPALGMELWRTDGTAAGTSLVADLNPGGASASPFLLAGTANLAYFTAFDPDHGRELWATDGTTAGTRRVADTVVGPDGGLEQQLLRGVSFELVGDRLFLSTYGVGLWVSDGSEAGTSQVPGMVSASSFAALGNRVLFNGAMAGGESELWTSDGTAGGTSLVKDFQVAHQSGNPVGLTTVGDQVFLTAYEDTTGRELWVTDGTEAGTTLVLDLVPGGGSGSTHLGMAPLGGRLLFFANDGVSGFEPWISDGSAEGTVRIGDVLPGPEGSFDAGWQFETNVHQALPLSGDSVFLRLSAGGFDLEGWRIDGDPTPGATRVAGINEQTSAIEVANLGFSFLPSMGALAEQVLFSADDGALGQELWSSDGTAVGTALVREVQPGPEGSWPTGLVSIGGLSIFKAFGNPSPLWRTDGTESGTQAIPALDANWDLARLGDRVYFSAWEGANSYLWSTDGTAAARVPGSPLDCCRLFLSPFADRLAFAANDQLLLTDGSPGGTEVLADGLAFEANADLTPAGSSLFFTWGEAASGAELGVFDGSVVRKVVDLRPGPEGAIVGWRPNFERLPPDKIAALGSRVVFLADDGVTGEEPWSSDGTEANTLPLADVFPGPRSSGPDQLTSTDAGVFFVADDGVHGRELWTTDGTAVGTRLVLDIQPGAGSSLPRHLKAIGGRLVFAAYDEILGVEAWVTDGTPEGTFRLGDIAPGALSSSPTHFTAAGDLVFFAANDNVSGFELWALQRASLDSAPLDYFTVTPCRLYDSRAGGAVGSSPIRVTVAGRCGVPPSARSVAVNLTAVGGTSAGRLRIGSPSTPPGAIEILPFAVGVARAEMAVLRLAYGELEIAALLDGGAGHSVEVIVDVTGYFQ